MKSYTGRNPAAFSPEDPDPCIDLVEVRFLNGRVHMKSALIDQQLLLVGSQNFHYSSFSKGGLLEFVAATESKTAIEEYQQMFEYYCAQSNPADDATWGTTGE